MPEDSGSRGIKAQLLTLSEVGVLVRKARTYELPSLKTFSDFAKKNYKGGGAKNRVKRLCNVYILTQ